MDREIVIVTPTESGAYDALKALKELDRDGTIELYASAVLTKGSDGTLSVKERENDTRTGVGTMLGLSIGALIGLLAGPAGVVTGAAAGAAATGAAAGGVADIGMTGVAGDFLHEVARNLQPGTFALVASVWEDWTVPVDTAVTKLGGKVMRQGSHDVAVAQIKAGVDELDDEGAYIDQQIDQAAGEAQADLRAKREEIKTRQAEQRKKLHARADVIQKTWDAKLASVHEKAKASAALSKARHEEHKQKLERFVSAQKASFRELFSSHPS